MKEWEARISRANMLSVATCNSHFQWQIVRETRFSRDRDSKWKFGQKIQEFTDNITYACRRVAIRNRRIEHVPRNIWNNCVAVATRCSLEPRRLWTPMIVPQMMEEEEVNRPRQGVDEREGSRQKRNRRRGTRARERWGYERDCEFVRASKKGERKNARGFTLMYRPRWTRKRKDSEEEGGKAKRREGEERNRDRGEEIFVGYANGSTPPAFSSRERAYSLSWD